MYYYVISNYEYIQVNQCSDELSDQETLKDD